MARIVPSDLTRLALSGAHQPEIVTLAYLRDTLPDDYTVFHGVHWSRGYKGNTVYGEIDFVVLNPAGQVLCIEQKNGPLVEQGGRLIRAYGEQQKNVVDQILRSIDSIREKFRFQCGAQPRLEIEYLIYCPDHAVKRLNAAAIDPANVVDAPKAGQLAEYVQKRLPLHTPESSDQARQVEAFFRQTFEVVPDIHAHIGAQEKNFTRLSGGLVEILDHIEMDPLRLRVLATAGDGKTLVASHFFSKAVAAGRRPLLLCFNRPLAERLRHLVEAEGLVNTWYGFCHQFLESQGVGVDFHSVHSDPAFWTKVAQKVTDRALAGLPDDWRFGTLIIDEAQDFEADWFETARLFVGDKDPILWLEDPNQNVRGTDALSLQDQGFVGYRSMVNYRSPEHIARFIQGVLPELQFTCGNDLPGLGVGVSTYADPSEQPKIVGKLVGRLLAQRFQASQIVILSCRGLESTALNGVDRVGNHTLSRFTKEYDLFGNQVLTKGQVLFDTVRRFKGQQEAAVILTDVAPRGSQLQQELQILFCGMTRATVRLEVVCDAGNSWVEDHLTPVARAQGLLG